MRLKDIIPTSRWLCANARELRANSTVLLKRTEELTTATKLLVANFSCEKTVDEAARKKRARG